MEDKFILGGKEFQSRFILGSGKYNLNLIKAAVGQGGAEIITLALRRANTQESENILDFIPEEVTLLPNTSGARNAEEAVRIARLSRAMGCGNFVKVEIMRDAKYLFPDNYETVKATEILAKEGFVVLPYMNPDLNVARDLQSAGAAAVMPLAAPIGSNKGLATKEMIQILIDEIDLHLHPAWQRHIVGALKKIFPKVQFIVSTHAPSVISSVPQDEIVILENHQVRKAEMPTYGKDANSILKTVMDVPERPDYVAEKLTAFYECLSKSDLKQARKMIDEIKNVLGEDDPEVVGAETSFDLEAMV